MRQRGHNHLLLNVDDAELEENLFVALEKLWGQAEATRDGIGRTVAQNLRLMARMGMYFEELVAKQYPDFPLRRESRDWDEYLPPLSGNLRKLLDTYDA